VKVGSLEIDLLANIAKLQADMTAAKAAVGATMDYIDAKVGSLKNALIGLAAGLTIGAFAAFTMNVVGGARALNELSIQTGATVESLSAMSAVGKQTNTTAQDIAGMMTKLARNMAGAREEGKGTGLALKALGIDFDSFKRLKPDEQMLAVAKAMNQYADSGEKSAAIQAILGKGAAQYLPFLKDLAETGTLQAKVTKEQAEAADQFERNIIKAKATSEGWKKEIVLGMLPALNEWSKAFLDVMNGTGGVRDEVKKLSKDGSIADWTRSVLNGVSYVIDAFHGVTVVVKSVGEYIGALVVSNLSFFDSLGTAVRQWMTGNIFGAIRTVGAEVGRQKAVWGGLAMTLNDMWSEKGLGQQLRERAAELKGMGVVAEETRARMKYANLADGNEDKKAIAQHNAYVDLIASINAKIATMDKEAETGEKLTETQQMAIEIEKMLAKETITEADAHSSATKALLARMKASEDFKADTLANVEAMKKLNEQLDSDSKKYKDELEAQKLHNEEIGKSTVEIAALASARLDDKAAMLERRATLFEDIDLSGQMSQKYRDEAQTLRDLAQAKRDGAVKQADYDSFKTFWGSIDKTAHDVWTNIFEGGSNVFKKLRDTLKSTLLDALYQMTVRPFIINIAANMMGASGPAAMSAITGGTNALSAGSSLMNGGGILGGIGSAFMSGYTGATAAGSAFAAGGAASSAFGVGAGATGALEMATIGGGTAATAGAGGLMAGASAALAAIPVYGWIALGAMALYSMFGGKGHGPKTESGYSAGGAFGSTPDTGDTSQAKTMADQITGLYSSVAGVMGLARTTLQAGVFVSKDPNGTAQTQLAVQTANYDRGSLYGTVENAGRSDAELAAAFQLSELQAVVVELQHSISEQGLTGDVADLVNAIHPLTDSMESMQKALQVVQDVSTLNTALGALGAPLSAITQWSAAGKEALIQFAGGIQTLTQQMSSFMNDFGTQAEKQQALATQISKTLTAGGLSTSVEQVLAMTRDQFKAWVTYSISVGDGGAKAVATLLSVEAAFNALHPAVQNATTDVLDLTNSVDDLGNTAGDTAQQLLDTLKQNMDDAQAKLMGAYNSERQRLLQVIDAHHAYADELRKFRDSLLLGNNSPLSATEQFSVAQSQFRSIYQKAMTGDSAALSQLSGASTSYLNAAQATSSTSGQYDQIFAEVQTALTLSATKSDVIADAAQSQLNKMDDQLKTLGLIDDHVTTFTEALLSYINARNAAAAGGVPGVTPAGSGSGAGSASGNSTLASVAAYGQQYGGDAYYLAAGINDYASKLAAYQNIADDHRADG
jgi:hypothetical protein